MPILGMIGSEGFAAERFKSVRRKVFYDYPNGKAPLTGLTSLLKEESCSDYEFKWYEKRMGSQTTVLVENAAGLGPFAGAAATTLTWGNVTRTGGRGIDAGGASQVNDKISMKVSNDAIFRAGHIIEIRDAITNTPTCERALFKVAAVGAGNSSAGTPAAAGGAGYLDCYFINVISAGMANNTAPTGYADHVNTGKSVLIVGSAHAQGATGSSMGAWNLPIPIANFTQIFRQSFSISRTAMKIAATFDPGGVYDDRAKEASVNHMVEIERAFLFGVKSMDTGTYTATGGVTVAGTDMVTTTTGGLLHFLEAWEAANSVYRGGSGAAAVTADATDEKRILGTNTTITLTEKLYDTYLERVFRYTKNTANEKLVFCGNQFLLVVNQLYKSKSCLDASLPMTETYGMDVVKHRTPFGTVYYKTHPLFNENPTLRSAAMFIDTGNLVYRYITDTDLLENRQANDADGRKDEWLTECGLEFRFPESHMFMQNVLDYAP